MIKQLIKKTGIFLIAVVVTVIINLFFFEIYHIPSESMSPTLQTGDVVLLNKFSYGYRSNKIPDRRFLPLEKPERNDILIFNLPTGDSVFTNHPMSSYYNIVSKARKQEKKRQLRVIQKGKQLDSLDLTKIYGSIQVKSISEREKYIKRCIAIPGDTILITDGKPRVNEFKTPFYYDSIKHQHYTKHKTDSGDFLISTLKDRYIFPHSTDYNWHVMYFGPLYVPKKGQTIKLSRENLSLYQRVIAVYEGNELTVDEGAIKINGEEKFTYTFKYNYYFVMGDNTQGSQDSRYWGFLPENHIIGKVSTILGSFDPSGMRWDRFFKEV